MKINQLERMGIPSEIRDMWVSNRRRDALLIPSPYEDGIQTLRAKTCSEEGFRQRFKVICNWGAVSAVPALCAVCIIPWAKSKREFILTWIPLGGFMAACFYTSQKYSTEYARKNALLQQALDRQK